MERADVAPTFGPPAGISDPVVNPGLQDSSHRDLMSKERSGEPVPWQEGEVIPEPRWTQSPQWLDFSYASALAGNEYLHKVSLLPPAPEAFWLGTALYCCWSFSFLQVMTPQEALLLHIVCTILCDTAPCPLQGSVTLCHSYRTGTQACPVTVGGTPFNRSPHLFGPQLLNLKVEEAGCSLNTF